MPNSYYLDRIARAAAAQSTASNPRPDYALSMALGAAPMPDSAFDSMTNAIQYDAEALEQANKERGKFLANIGAMMNFTQALGEASKRKNRGVKLGHRDEGDSWWDDAKKDIGAVGDIIGDGIGSVFGAVDDAAHAVRGGLLAATTDLDYDTARQASEGLQDVSRAEMGEGLAVADKYIFTPVKRGIATLGHAANVSVEDGGPGGALGLMTPGAIAEGWERSEFGTPGQALADTVFMEPDKREAAYAAGFDEFGQPLDETYRQMRESNTGYNLTSGTADFAVSWFADPLVVVGKGASLTRAAVKLDFSRLSPATGARVKTIFAAPEGDALLESARRRAKWDPVTRRALTVRDEMGQMRDAVRAGTEDAVSLQEKVQAFQQSPVGAYLFAEAAKIRKFEPGVGVIDEFDDDAFRTWTAATMNHPEAVRKVFTDPRFEELADGRKIEEEQGRVLTLDERVSEAQTIVDKYEGQTPYRHSKAYTEIMAAREDLPKLINEAELAKGQLAQYSGYQAWHQGMLNMREQATVSMAPRLSSSLGETLTATFRPTGLSGVANVATAIPKHALLRRPGVANLHDPNGFYNSMSRYFDSTLNYGSHQAADEVAAEVGAGTFDQLRNVWLNKAIGATNDVQRRQVAGEIERLAFEVVARKHGLTGEDAQRLSTALDGKRREAMDAYAKQSEQTRQLSSATGKNGERLNSFSIKSGDTVEELFLPDPTDLQQTFIGLDLRHLNSTLSRHGSGLRSALGGPADMIEEGLGFYTRLWKPAVLFRGGYPIRTIADEGLRVLAATSTLLQLPGLAAQGLGTGTVNLVRRGGNRAMRRAARKGKRPLFSSRRGLERWIEKGGWAPRVAGESRTFTSMIPGQSKEGVSIGGRTWATAFKAGEGDRYLDIISSRGQLGAKLTDTYNSELSAARQELLADGGASVMKGDPGFVAAWKKELDDFAVSPIWRQMLDGVDDDKIISWLKYQPEGRELSRRMPWQGHNPERWVESHRQTYDSLVPDEKTRARLMADGNIDEDALRHIVEMRPHLAPESIDRVTTGLTSGRSKISERYNKFVSMGYDLIAGLPTDTLVRQPFFRMQYKNELRRVAAALDDGVEITDKVRRSLETSARNHAVKETRRYMFSLADDTELVHTMRFISPFMGAWQETLTKWGSILMERPEAFARLWVNGFEDMDDLYGVDMVTVDGLTAEEDARAAEIEGRDPKDADHVRTKLFGDGLKFLEKILPGNQESLTGAAETFQEVKINKSNLNSIIQGEYWYLPGNGPVVQFPAKHLMQNNPEWETEGGLKEFLWKYIFPTGVPDNADFLLPAGYQQQALAWLQGEDSPSVQRMAINAWQYDHYRWEVGGRVGPEPTADEAMEKANVTMAYNIAARFFSPAGYTVETPGQYLIDQANSYQAMYGWGDEAMQKFTEQYGDDALVFWHSTSRSNNNLPPTAQGVEGFKKYDKLAGRYPDIADAIVGMDAKNGEFSMAAYTWQMGNSVGGGSQSKMRERMTVDEYARFAEAQDGWNRYTQFNNEMVTELAARGLQHESQAPELAMAKQAFLSANGQEFPEWANDFRSFDSNKGYDVVRQFREAFDNEDAPDRPDWTYGVSRFLDLWDAFGSALDERNRAGGSRDIGAKSNADLAVGWEFAMQDLVESNPMFADMYFRHLNRATLERGTG